RCLRNQATSSAWPSGVLGIDTRSSVGERMQASIFRFDTSMPTIRLLCGILRLPSLLVRALTPMQLFGLKEDTGPVPRSSAGFTSGEYGLRFGGGRLFHQPPAALTFSEISDTRGSHPLDPPLSPHPPSRRLRRDGKPIR